jgi:alkane 1-monooxygenase
VADPPLAPPSAARFRFLLAAALPVAVGAALWSSAVAAWATLLGIQLGFALLERVPGLDRSPAAAPQSRFHRTSLWLHGALQAALLSWGLVWLLATPAGQAAGWGAVVLAGLAVGGITGSQGITFAHELGHSKRRSDRVLAWALMTSVCYAHFMVEHYRGHHPRAATRPDPASARRGESLWRFLPRTLAGSFLSAWALEARQNEQLKRSWLASPLVIASAVQAAWLATLLGAFGHKALVFWLVQSAYAVFLLEAVNYIEHYGLERKPGAGGRPEPFGLQHAWNADHVLTNSVLANLQRHSDHHMHAWKPYAELQPLPGPQLPTGYAGCLFIASVPPWWFALMEPRLKALDAAAPANTAVQATP